MSEPHVQLHPKNLAGTQARREAVPGCEAAQVWLRMRQEAGEGGSGDSDGGVGWGRGEGLVGWVGGSKWSGWEVG